MHKWFEILCTKLFQGIAIQNVSVGNTTTEKELWFQS
jgi:hypothetical protein